MGYKRNIFLINPKFQIKFSLIICTLIAVSSLMYPFAIYNIFEFFIEKMPQIKTHADAIQSTVFITLVIFQAVFIFGVFIIFIFISHKIAGPMYKLKIFLRSIADGNAPETLFFRKGDYFRDIADDINDAFGKLRTQHQEDTHYIQEVISYLDNLALAIPEDKKPVLRETITRLNQIKNRFQDET